MELPGQLRLDFSSVDTIHTTGSLVYQAPDGPERRLDVVRWTTGLEVAHEEIAYERGG